MIGRAKWMIFLGCMIAIGMANPVSAQQEDEEQQRGAQVEEMQGEAREVELEAAITAEPARPVISFTYSRPSVNFGDVRIGVTSRSFFPELRRGSEMEVGSPVIDIIGLFPGLLPGL